MFDWHQFRRNETHQPAVVDPRRRVRICLAALGVLLAVIFFRAVQLELAYGAAYRAEALKPIEKLRSVPGVRGKILTRDGVILACDKEISCVAVRYRSLENPPDPKWLKTAVRAAFQSGPRQARPGGRGAEPSAGRTRRSGAPPGATLQDDGSRVERPGGADPKPRRKDCRRGERPPGAKAGEAEEDDESYAAWFARLLREPRPPPGITVAEELDYHVMCDAPPAAAVAEIESHSEKYPGVKIVKRSRRFYPQGKSAANVLGYLGLAGEANDADYHADDWVGKLGIEKSCETVLRGRRGTAADITRHDGRVVEQFLPRSARDRAGCDARARFRIAASGRRTVGQRACAAAIAAAREQIGGRRDRGDGNCRRLAAGAGRRAAVRSESIPYRSSGGNRGLARRSRAAALRPRLPDGDRARLRFQNSHRHGARSNRAASILKCRCFAKDI